MNKNQRRELAALIGKYSKADGLNDTAIAPLHYFKMSAPSARIPVVYNASLCLGVQGAKEVMLSTRAELPSPFEASLCCESRELMLMRQFCCDALGHHDRRQVCRDRRNLGKDRRVHDAQRFDT